MANTSKGRFPSYGLVRGPSHADGGVPASVANGPDVELEGGEYIIPKEAVPDYLPVLQQITQVGRDRQQMQNGNTAIDALIASASMQNGIAQPKSPMYMGGGMLDEYEEGGEVHSRRMYNQGTGFDKKKSDLDGDGEISEYERKRGMAIAKAMGKMQMGGMVGMQRPMNPAMNFSPMQRMNPRMYQEGGQVDKGAYPAKDMEMLKQFPLTYKFFMDRRGQQSYYPEQDSLAARMFRGEIDPNEAFSKALMLPLTQEKGTAPPRRQQEIRNPNERFGPPDSLAYSVKDLEKQAQENFESFMDSLEYRRSLNPFTGKPMDTDADLERLRKRMIQSRIPPSKQRMPMQEGGQIPSARSMRPSVEAQERLLRDLQERGLVGTNPADTPGFFPLASQAQPGSLIEAISSDRRVMPLEMQSDRYMTEIPNAKNYQSYEMQPPVYSKEVTVVPKLSTAYLASFGIETPLSKRQQELLLRKGVAPKTLNPSVKGLINRVLVQRLGNENN